MSKREYNTSIVAVVFVLAGALLFGASMGYPFHFDDGLILSDSNVTNAARWSHFLNPLHLRQLTYSSFYLNYLAGGTNPAGFHAVNVLIHIANAILLFSLLKRFVEPETAAVAAAVFLVHPIQTEPVFYVYQRSTLLACLFSLCALHAFQARRWWLAFLFFFLAFESKESALAVPLALGLLYKHRTRKWLIAGAVIGVAAALAILMYRNETTVGMGAAAAVTPWRYLETQLRVVYTYFRLLVWPYAQSIEYEFPVSQALWLKLGEIAGLAAIVAAGVWAFRTERMKLAGLAILTFFLFLAPTSSIIPSTDAAFEHRLYLPMMAFSLLVALALSRLPKRNTAAAVVLILLSLMTFSRGTVWASGVALWRDAVTNAPGKARAWFNLGSAQMAADPQAARTSLRRAIDLDPRFPGVYVNFGVLEQNARNFAQAVLYFQEAIRQNERSWPAWYNLGNAWFAMGKYDRAIASFERTLSLNREYYGAHYNIAVTYLAAGRPSEAVPHIRTVLDWDPQSAEARKLLAEALKRSGGE